VGRIAPGQAYLIVLEAIDGEQWQAEFSAKAP